MPDWFWFLITSVVALAGVVVCVLAVSLFESRARLAEITPVQVDRVIISRSIHGDHAWHLRCPCGWHAEADIGDTAFRVVNQHLDTHRAG